MLVECTDVDYSSNSTTVTFLELGWVWDPNTYKIVQQYHFLGWFRKSPKTAQQLHNISGVGLGLDLDCNSHKTIQQCHFCDWIDTRFEN